MNKLYKANIGTIYDRVNFYKRKSPAEYEELICMANMAFVEAYQNWDAKKASFNTHLYNTLDKKLGNFIRGEKKRFSREINGASLLIDSLPYYPTQYEVTMKLPEESKQIIKIIFDPSEKIENKLFNISKRSIKQHLEKKGWDRKSIIKGMNAIETEISQEQTNERSY